MNYEEMSDLEINGKVAELIYGAFETFEESVYVEPKHSGDNIVPVSGIFDPYNSWADAGPIIAENGIGVVKVVEASCGTGGVIGRWHAVGPVDWAYGECDSDVAHWEQNPLRAAMIVFLMMQESK